LGLFKIIKAAITPGIHPQSHNKNTIIIDPHPLSKTDIRQIREETQLLTELSRYSLLVCFMMIDVSI